MKGIYTSNGTPIELGNNIQPETQDVIKVLYQAKVKSTDTKLNMRKEPNKSSERIMYIPPQGIVDVIEETNTDWWKVIYTGETGYVMQEYLTKELSDTSKDYYIKIKCGSEADARLIAKALQGAAVIEG